MNFQHFIYALAIASHLLPGLHTPTKNAGDWKVHSDWEKVGDVYVFEATSHAIVEACAKSPHSYVHFPTVIQSAQQVYLDGKLIAQTGDPTFASSRSYYGAPELSCSIVGEGHEIQWKAYAYAECFANASSFPFLTRHYPWQGFFTEPLNLMVSGSLLVVGLFVLLLLWGNIAGSLSAFIALFSLFWSLYFLGTTSGLFGISLPMLLNHKLTETTLWWGFTFFFFALKYQGVPGAEKIDWVVPILGLGTLLTLIASNGTVIQFSTTLQMIAFLTLGVYTVTKIIGFLTRIPHGRKQLFELLSLSTILGLGFNDGLAMMGVIDTPLLFAMGALLGQLFFALSVNEEIRQMHRERDYLREHLEEEVEIKTSELRHKTEVLEKTMHDLKDAQGELIQSTRLASLGTLAAGIAHEINNALNYVYGSLKPLQRCVEGITDEDTRTRATKLTTLMNEGLKLTFEIIKSLRSYTGLNQAQFGDVSIREVFESVLTIIKSKIGDTKIVIEADPELRIFASVVALNQIFMNLITNALLAMPKGGTLTLSAKREGDNAEIRVSDTGTGIAPEVLARVFEPFFTTREVGSGTGLGLYIVRKEIDRHHGKIEVQSEVGKGTTFLLTLPVKEEGLGQQEIKEKAA